MFLAMRIVLSSQAMHHIVNLYLTIPFSSEEKHGARIYRFVYLLSDVLLHGTKCKSVSLHKWRSPERWFIFELANSCLNTPCELYLSGGLLKNNTSFADVCYWFKDIDFQRSLLKTGKRPMFW